MFPYLADNYASTVDQFEVTMFYSPDGNRVDYPSSLAYIKPFMVNEIKFSSKLNLNFQKALDQNLPAA